jgi:acyl-CoA thioesterase-1
LRTGAKVVWASSTPLPAESTYGSDAAITKRNEIAARVMQRHAIPLDDLYATIHPRLGEFQKTNDVHYSDSGYVFLGGEVARAITRELPAK